MRGVGVVTEDVDPDFRGKFGAAGFAYAWARRCFTCHLVGVFLMGFTMTMDESS